MRVTIIGPAHPLRGGIAHHVYCLKRDLTDRGHTVQVISFRSLYPRLLFPGTTQLDNSAATLDPGSVAILSPTNPLTWTRAAKTVKAFSPDAVILSVVAYIFWLDGRNAGENVSQGRTQMHS